MAPQSSELGHQRPIGGLRRRSSQSAAARDDEVRPRRTFFAEVTLQRGRIGLHAIRDALAQRYLDRVPVEAEMIVAGATVLKNGLALTQSLQAPLGVGG